MINQTNIISNEVEKTLEYYVYAYYDPRDGKLFYIGKGKENRLFAHLHDQSENAKSRRIAEIYESGKEPIIEVLRYGLTDNEAGLVEAACIDLVGLKNLTNQVAGHHHSSFGRINSKELIAMLQAESVEITHKVILLKISRLYRSAMTPFELYEATRGIWKASGQRRNHVQFAFALFQGIVKEVYEIEHWDTAGTTPYTTRPDIAEHNLEGRWEFKGHPAPQEIRERYIGKRVDEPSQNPIRYVNV